MGDASVPIEAPSQSTPGHPPDFVICGGDSSEFCYKAFLAFSLKDQSSPCKYTLQRVDIRDLKGSLAPPHTVPQLLYAGVNRSEGSGGLLTDSTDILKLLDSLYTEGPLLFPNPLAAQIHDEVSDYFKDFTRYWFMVDPVGRWKSFGPRVQKMLPWFLQYQWAADWMVSSKVNEFKEKMKGRLVSHYGANVDDVASMQEAFDKALQSYEDRLAGDNRWLAGTPDPSGADIALWSMLAKLYEGTSAGPPCKQECLNEFPNLRDWYQRFKLACPLPDPESLIWSRESRAAMLAEGPTHPKWANGVWETWHSVPVVKAKLGKAATSPDPKGRGCC